MAMAFCSSQVIGAYPHTAQPSTALTRLSDERCQLCRKGISAKLSTNGGAPHLCAARSLVYNCATTSPDRDVVCTHEGQFSDSSRHDRMSATPIHSSLLILTLPCIYIGRWKG